MCQNPALLQVIARDRAAALRRGPGSAARDRRVAREVGVRGTARRTAGWLLVDLGLRLALPRDAIKHGVARHSSSS